MPFFLKIACLYRYVMQAANHLLKPFTQDLKNCRAENYQKLGSKTQNTEIEYLLKSYFSSWYLFTIYLQRSAPIHISTRYSTVLHSTYLDGLSEQFVSRTHLVFLSFRKPYRTTSDYDSDTAENGPSVKISLNMS